MTGDDITLPSGGTAELGYTSVGRIVGPSTTRTGGGGPGSSGDGEGSGDARQERIAAMCRMRAEGQSLQVIADHFGLSRERVRQIIRDADGPDKLQAAAAREAMKEDGRQVLRAQALQLCQDQPGLTLVELAALLGATPEVVRSALGPDARRLLITMGDVRTAFTDEEVLDHIRRAAQIAGVPLTVRLYEKVRSTQGGASTPLVVKRFGTWRAACDLAGVESGRPVRARYDRRWTREELIAAVSLYLADPDARGSFADYERWAKGVESAPSGQTIRTNLESWSAAKSAALQAMAHGDGQAGGVAEPV